MPQLIRLYVTQVLVGFALAAVFVAGLIWLDIAGLKGLIARSDSALLAVFMLWFMNGIVFAGVQFAWKIMSLAEIDEGPRGGSVVSDLRPAPVRQEAARRG